MSSRAWDLPGKVNCRPSDLPTPESTVDQMVSGQEGGVEGEPVSGHGFRGTECLILGTECFALSRDLCWNGCWWRIVKKSKDSGAGRIRK